MKNVIGKVLKFGVLVSTYGLIISVLIQILARFLLPTAPSWTEEASRLFFIYTVAFGVGLAYEKNDFIYLDLFFERLPKKIQNIGLGIITLASLALFGIMFVYSIKFTLLGHAEFSPGMKIRMSFAFASMIILSASMCYYIIQEYFSPNSEDQ